MNEELLGCPFCGEVPELPDGNGTQYELYCDCGMACSTVQISDLMTREERNEPNVFDGLRYKEAYVNRARQVVISQWNTRFNGNEK